MGHPGAINPAFQSNFQLLIVLRSFPLVNLKKGQCEESKNNFLRHRFSLNRNLAIMGTNEFGLDQVCVLFVKELAGCKSTAETITDRFGGILVLSGVEASFIGRLLVESGCFL